MAYCTNCGTELVTNGKFCQKCGNPTGVREEGATRKQEFAGKIYKCPSCGEVLKAFEINCPACGYELRGTKASSAIKEFALKLEAIESRREYEKARGIFATSADMIMMSKTDKQKISLINSFVVPNSKEDMLEFMILATSNINMRAFELSNTSVSKSDKELNNAWLSKVQQVFEKARRSYSTDDVFADIEALYNKCNLEISKSKRKGIIKIILLFGWFYVLVGVVLLWAAIFAPIDEKKELARLEEIVNEIEMQLENGEYKYALMNADDLIYSGSISNDEQSRKWEIKREYWIDKIIEEAAQDGVILERPTEKSSESAIDEEMETSGFVESINDGMQPGLDAAKESINEFNQIMKEYEDTKNTTSD